MRINQVNSLLENMDNVALPQALELVGDSN